MTVEELNKTYSYQFPPMLLMYWAAALPEPPFRFKSRAHQKVTNSQSTFLLIMNLVRKHSIRSESGEREEGTKEHCLVSLRTIELLETIESQEKVGTEND